MTPDPRRSTMRAGRSTGYQLRKPVGLNTMILELNRTGACEVLRCATVRKVERARGVRRYITDVGMLIVWQPSTVASEALKRYRKDASGTWRAVWGGPYGS